MRTFCSSCWQKRGTTCRALVLSGAEGLELMGLTLEQAKELFRKSGQVYAIYQYEGHLAITRETGDRRGEGNALGNLGSAYFSLGDARKAIEFHEQALIIDREIGDRRGEGQDLGNLGNAYADLGDARKAIEFYEQILIIDREIGDRRGEATDSWNLGAAYEQEGELQKAIDLMQVLVDYEREIGHPEAEEHAAHVEELRKKLNDSR